MAHSLVKVYVHYVWTTKHRERTILGEARQFVKTHIEGYSAENKILIDTLHIQPEHVHALILLQRDQRVEDVPKLLKGESSHWINEEDILPGKFSWQTGYAAFSVDFQGLDAVRYYINNQEERHRRKSFKEEFESILREHGYSDEEITTMLDAGNR